MILYEEGATQAQHDEAHGILEALTVAYPGHPWAVRVYGDDTGGGFFIRHLEFPANWGMNCRHSTRLYSASAMKREVIMMAGEWLERANLKRGRENGDETERVEGVPDKYQPHQPLPDNIEVVIAPAQEERTQPRPQVLKEAIDGD